MASSGAGAGQAVVWGAQLEWESSPLPFTGRWKAQFLHPAKGECLCLWVVPSAGPGGCWEAGTPLSPPSVSNSLPVRDDQALVPCHILRTLLRCRPMWSSPFHWAFGPQLLAEQTSLGVIWAVTSLWQGQGPTGPTPTLGHVSEAGQPAVGSGTLSSGQEAPETLPRLGALRPSRAPCTDKGQPAHLPMRKRHRSWLSSMQSS